MMTQLVQCAFVAGAPLHDALVPPQRLQANETLVTIRTATRVMIDGSTALHRLPETFVSFTMEASIASSYDLDLWGNKQLQALASHLAPSVLRFGGVSQDHMAYDFERREGGDVPCSALEPQQDCVMLRAEHLQGIVDFTKSAGWDLVFGLNVATARDPNTDEWDPAELDDLIWQSDPDRVNARYYGLELGNEPDHMCKVPSGERFCCGHAPTQAMEDEMEVSMTPQQLASDYKHFRERLRHLWRHRSPKTRPKVIGSDVSSILMDTPLTVDYAKDFLKALETPLDAFTYHFYYSSFEKEMQIEDYSTVETLDTFRDAAVSAHEMIKEHGRGAELWLGETSSVSHGGTKNATASFLAGFLWLDMLGIAAVTGHRHVFRQTFARTSYAVVGMLLSAHISPSPPPSPLSPMDFQPPPCPPPLPPFEPPPGSPPSPPSPGSPQHGSAYDDLPNPDYWTTVLWQSLVGNLVLSTDTKINPGRSVRVYAFCSAKDLGYVGGVTLAVVQTKDTEAELDLEMLSQTVGARGRADLYWLTSYPGQPISRDIFLNGHVLRVVDEETMELPQLRNMVVSLTAEQPIVLPPKSYGFIVLPDAGAAACSKQQQEPQD